MFSYSSQYLKIILDKSFDRQSLKNNQLQEFQSVCPKNLQILENFPCKAVQSGLDLIFLYWLIQFLFEEET